MNDFPFPDGDGTPPPPGEEDSAPPKMGLKIRGDLGSGNAGATAANIASSQPAHDFSLPPPGFAPLPTPAPSVMNEAELRYEQVCTMLSFFLQFVRQSRIVDFQGTRVLEIFFISKAIITLSYGIILLFMLV